MKATEFIFIGMVFFIAGRCYEYHRTWEKLYLKAVKELTKN